MIFGDQHIRETVGLGSSNNRTMNQDQFLYLINSTH